MTSAIQLLNQKDVTTALVLSTVKTFTLAVTHENVPVAAE